MMEIKVFHFFFNLELESYIPYCHFTICILRRLLIYKSRQAKNWLRLMEI